MKNKKSSKKKKQKRENRKITAKMSFALVMKKYPEAAKILFEKGMACMGCPMAMQETIEQGALAHGINPEKLVEELNAKIKRKIKNDNKL